MVFDLDRDSGFRLQGFYLLVSVLSCPTSKELRELAHCYTIDPSGVFLQWLPPYREAWQKTCGPCTLKPRRFELQEVLLGLLKKTGLLKNTLSGWVQMSLFTRVAQLDGCLIVFKTPVVAIRRTFWGNQCSLRNRLKEWCVRRELCSGSWWSLGRSCS